MYRSEVPAFLSFAVFFFPTCKFVLNYGEKEMLDVIFDKINNTKFLLKENNLVVFKDVEGCFDITYITTTFEFLNNLFRLQKSIVFS
jgi:hypothetical protein